MSLVCASSEVVLKMLADDRYCGRIIGKEGKMIKKIREDTVTKITVSKYVPHYTSHLVVLTRVVGWDCKELAQSAALIGC